MTFPVTCLVCGHVDQVEWSQIGQKTTCGGCRKTSTVPAPMETVGQPVVRVLCLKFACPSCGRKFATKPDLAGKKIRCNRCGKGVRVPEDDAIFLAKSSRSDISSFEESDDEDPPPRPDRDRPDRAKSRARTKVRPRADDEVAATAPRRSAEGLAIQAEVHAKTDQTGDDSSRADVNLAKLRESKRHKQVETVLPSRSESIEQARQRVAESEVVETKQKAEKTKKKKKRKKGSGFFDPKETLKLVAGVGAVVGGLAFLAWGYPEFRFPLGGLLCVIGFITYLLGSVSIRQIVAEEGLLKVLVFRFCPPYQWWFVATHWEETKDFVAFFGAGLLIMAIGSGIIKTSATGRRAEESDRAYQKAMRDQRTTVPTVPLKGFIGGDHEGTAIEGQR